MSSQSSNSGGKPADYVYFERTTAGFSEDALPRSKAAQLKLEHYYKVAVEAAIERNQRCVSVCAFAVYLYSTDLGLLFVMFISRIGLCACVDY
jgi:hypothetical protein